MRRQAMPPQLRRQLRLRGGLTHAIGGFGVGVASPLWGLLALATVWVVIDAGSRTGASVMQELGQLYFDVFLRDVQLTLLFWATLAIATIFVAVSWLLGTFSLRRRGFRRAFPIMLLAGVFSWFVPSVFGAGIGMLHAIVVREILGSRLVSGEVELFIVCFVSAVVVAGVAAVIGAFATPLIARWLQSSHARSRPRPVPAGTAPVAP